MGWLAQAGDRCAVRLVNGVRAGFEQVAGLGHSAGTKGLIDSGPRTILGSRSCWEVPNLLQESWSV